MKILAQECSNDELGLTYGKIKFAFRPEEFMELLEGLGAKVNKCG